MYKMHSNCPIILCWGYVAVRRTQYKHQQTKQGV